MNPFLSSPELKVGIGKAKTLFPTTRPEAARLITLPWSVMGGPPMEMVLPSITTVPEARGVKVSPAPVRRPLELLVASGMVELPIAITDSPEARLIAVPEIVIAAEPGRMVCPLST